MAFVAGDRIKESCATTGTGTLTLAGAATAYQSFAAIGNANTCNFVILDGNGTDWECSTGTYTSSGTTLSRTTVFDSSNSGSKINLSANTHTVICTAIAGHLLQYTTELDNALGSTQGQVAYRSATAWTALNPGTSGTFLKSQGSSANPIWDTPAGGGSGSGLWSAAISGVPTQSGTGLTTWLNQGGATATNALTGIRIDLPSSGSDQVRGLYKAAPTAPYKRKFLVSFQAGVLEGIGHGVGWYDGSNKLSMLFFDIDGSGNPGIPGLIVLNFSNPTTFNSLPFNGSGKFLGLFPPIWFHLEDDATNVSFGWSTDGGNAPFILYTVAKSSGYLGSSGYSNIGFFANTHSANAAAATLQAFESY